MREHKTETKTKEEEMILITIS